MLAMASPSFLDYLALFLLRPVLAITFVLSFILLGWVMAWKLVSAHVPLLQEIRKSLWKKPVKQKPPSRRLSCFYSGANATAAQ